jgi:hypothetical protein
MIREDELLEMHQKLLEEQERLQPYLTIARMTELLQCETRGAAYHRLEKMVVRGLAERVEFGRQYRYRFLKGE